MTGASSGPAPTRTSRPDAREHRHAPIIRRALLALPLLLVIVHPLRAAEGDVNLWAGNPSGTVADRDKPDNYLLKKRQYALSYNNSKGTPNWVSWQLSKAWLGTTRRGNPFAPDTSLPAGFFVVRPTDYRAGGFDRGHVCPAADRSASREDMDATFLMDNMIPQAPNLNRGTWEKLELYSRDQVRDGEEILYIVAGPAGRGGTGSDGYRVDLPAAGGKITVPAKCWKVVLCVPAGVTDPKRLTAAQARVFAVVMPNQQGLSTDWRSYAVPVADVERLTGYRFFTHLAPGVARELRSRKPETRAKASPRTTAKGKEPKGAGLELPAFQPGCVVGNKKTKNYHVPGNVGYERAKTSKNVVFFKNAQDAEKAGYRAVKR
jgi:endonuclease G